MQNTVTKFIVEERYIELNESDICNLIAEKFNCHADDVSFDISSAGMLRGASISTTTRTEVKE